MDKSNKRLERLAVAPSVTASLPVNIAEDYGMDENEVNRLRRSIDRLNGHVAMLSAIIAHAVDIGALKQTDLRAMAMRLEPDDIGIFGSTPEVGDYSKHLLESLRIEGEKVER